MKAVASHLGASYHDNPLWLGRRVVTVHPLGGSPMGRHLGKGVCDEYGEVFGYPGLHVWDGSLLPGPVGANPSLTIAAVADRGCTHVIETSPRGGLLAGTASPTPVASTPAAPEADVLGVSFTERMKGFVSVGAAESQAGYAWPATPVAG